MSDARAQAEQALREAGFRQHPARREQWDYVTRIPDGFVYSHEAQFFPPEPQNNEPGGVNLIFRLNWDDLALVPAYLTAHAFAAEHARLRARVAQLEGALAPFAALHDAEGMATVTIWGIESVNAGGKATRVDSADMARAYRVLTTTPAEPVYTAAQVREAAQAVLKCPAGLPSVIDTILARLQGGAADGKRD